MTPGIVVPFLGMNAMPDVSIVMITWRPNDYRQEVMKRCFASLKAITKHPYILVVVDNGPEFLNSQGIDIHFMNDVNIGIAKSRNMGAEATDTKYIAFIDDDLILCEGWLGECISALEKYPNRKLIATPRKTSPMKHKKYFRGDLDEYQLWSRSSGQCMVMKRIDFEIIGLWKNINTPGGNYCKRLHHKKYSFIWHSTWSGRHLGKKPSYNYRNKLVNGIWEQR